MADIYSSGVLGGIVANLKVPQTPVLTRYFPAETRFDTEEISFDLIPGKRRVSPFVSPLVAGKIVESLGQSVRTFQPAYIKDKRPFDPNRPFKRAVGEQVGGNSLTPAERAQLHLAFEMQDQINMATRRFELMATEAIRLGSVTVVGDGYPSVTVSFQRSAGNTIAALTGTARWGQSAANPLDNLQDWALVGAQASGEWPKDVIMGTDAWKQFRKDPEVKARLLAINTMGQAMSQASALSDNMQYMGTLDGFNIFVYAGWYVDPATGSEGPIWPVGAVSMAAPPPESGTEGGVEGVRLFGAIRDEELGYVATPYAPKSWSEKDPAVRYLMMQSAPLMAPLRPDATVYVPGVV